MHYKEEEIKRINGDWESVSAKEADLSKMQAEARAKLSDVESREMSLKFREERLSQEKVFSLSMIDFWSHLHCNFFIPTIKSLLLLSPKYDPTLGYSNTTEHLADWRAYS